MERLHPDLLPPGFRYEIHKTVTTTDMYLWDGLAGDRYVAQSDTAFRQQTVVARTVMQDGYLVGLVISAASRLAAHIPPPGGRLVALSIRLGVPVLVGTTLTITMTVNGWDAVTNLYWLDIRATCSGGATAVMGQASLRLQSTGISVV